MCEITIHATGTIPEDKVNKDTIEEITTELRKFSPDARVQIRFLGTRT